MNPLVEVENISKTYHHHHKKTVALENVSLSIHREDIFGIIGLSGAGKSTLIRALARLVIPSSGRILFHNKDIVTMKDEELRHFRKNIGMIFQHFNLLNSRNVADNISYPLEIAGMSLNERQERIDALLQLVNLTDKKESYPSQLSGGEKQRVGIARALANRPELLLCDEATSALDPKTTREILALLNEINRSLGITIVLITHEMDVIKQICNKVAVIEKGKIVEEGLVSEIFADPQHSTTKNFLEKASHEIPATFFENPSNRKQLLRLKFKGKAANEPIMSDLVRKFDVNINILSGWIDQLQTRRTAEATTIGTLIIEVTGEPESIQQTLRYLQEKSVHYEVLKNDT